MLGVLGLGLGLFLLIAMLSLQAGRLVMGPFGKTSAGLFYGLAGIPGYFLIALGLVAAVRTLLEREPVMPILVTIGVVIGVVSFATLIHLAVPNYRVSGYGPGGAIGEHLAEVLRAVISTAGTALLGLVGLVVAVVVATPLRMGEVLRAIGYGFLFVFRGVQAAVFAFARFWADVFRAILPGKDHSRDEEDVDEEDVLEVGEDDGLVDPVIIERSSPNEEKKSRKKKEKVVQATEIDLVPPGPIVVEGETVEPAAGPPKPPKRSRMANGTQAPEIEEAKAEAAAAKQAEAVAAAPAESGPLIVESRFKHADKAQMAAKEKAAEAERQTFIKLGEGDADRFEEALHALLFHLRDRLGVEPGRPAVLLHSLPRFLENVTSPDAIVQRVESALRRLLGRCPQPVLKLLHVVDRLLRIGVIGPALTGHALARTFIADMPPLVALPSGRVVRHDPRRYYDPVGLPLCGGHLGTRPVASTQPRRRLHRRISRVPC